MIIDGLVMLPEVSQQRIAAAVESDRTKEHALMDHVRSSEFTLPGLRWRFLE